jgi:hypothetical protein
VPSSVVTGAAQGVMPAQVLGGPIWWFFFGVYLLAIGLAAFVLVDALRPVRTKRFAEIRESRLLYALASGTYLVFVVGVWVPSVPRVVSVVPVVLTPFELGLSVAYLLRVVFPKPPAEEEASTDDEDVISEAGRSESPPDGDDEAAPTDTGNTSEM